MEFLNPAGLRLDGRRPKELRRIACELGTLAHADGSALLQMGNTKVPRRKNVTTLQSCIAAANAMLCADAHGSPQVLAAVFGPHEPTSRGQANHERCTIQCDVAMAAFSFGERRRRGRSDRRVAEAVDIIRAAIEQTVLLELMPRSQVDITVQVCATPPQDVC